MTWQDRVDALDGIQVPEVNDQDGNGRADDLDVAAATAAVEAAEAADQAAKDKLAELNADNLITPEEKAQLEAAKQNADTPEGRSETVPCRRCRIPLRRKVTCRIV
ncbi:Uncharacterised protein [Escherichia coli]|uniref:Minor extracellular protease Epr GA-like domain-containing protein n=1 Tax=Escherichia coli TaxID=562 RepID=A0A376Y5D2_ECOLX|nr:Uncharacterised protein [Escherichia coli]